jgi:LacI family asc operon transcriptional repressor
MKQDRFLSFFQFVMMITMRCRKRDVAAATIFCSAVHCMHRVSDGKKHDHDAGSGEAGRRFESDGLPGAVGQWLRQPGDQRPGVQAIEESGYRPNAGAQPGDQNAQTLGLVVTNTLYHGVYFSELLFHAARMTEEKGRQRSRGR